MADREKVLKGIEACQQNDGRWCRQKCPYFFEGWGKSPEYCGKSALFKDILVLLKEQESKPIEYKACADAMLKMWMENVLADGEYNKIMDKLNKAHKEGRI